MSGIVPHVNALGYTAAQAAYRDGEAWRSALLEYLRGNCGLVMEAVGSMPGCSMTTVEATYLAWIDLRKSGIESPALFFEENGVGLSDGAEFGLPGFLRLNFGCCRSLLEEALRRMQAALAMRQRG
jgi:cystathionine beta-lyase